MFRLHVLSQAQNTTSLLPFAALGKQKNSNPQYLKVACKLMMWLGCAENPTGVDAGGIQNRKDLFEAGWNWEDSQYHVARLASTYPQITHHRENK